MMAVQLSYSWVWIFVVMRILASPLHPLYISRHVFMNSMSTLNKSTPLIRSRRLSNVISNFTRYSPSFEIGSKGGISFDELMIGNSVSLVVSDFWSVLHHCGFAVYEFLVTEVCEDIAQKIRCNIHINKSRPEYLTGTATSKLCLTRLYPAVYEGPRLLNVISPLDRSIAIHPTRIRVHHQWVDSKLLWAEEWN